MKINPGNAQTMGTRQEQQDAFGFSDIDDSNFILHGGVLAIVADGMGGMVLGRESSSLAVGVMLRHYMSKTPEESVVQTLRRSLEEANRAVYAMSVKNGVEGDTGTTLVAAVVFEDQLNWVSAGDSRLYLYRNGRTTRLTTDHVYARELDYEAAQGNISKEEAAAHPEREALTSYLGLAELPAVDSNVRPYPLQPGDRIVLCTDGLYGTLSEKEMTQQLKNKDPQQAAEKLISKAVRHGRPNQDNMTVAMMDLNKAGIWVKAFSRKDGLSGKYFLWAGILILIGAVIAAGIYWKMVLNKTGLEKMPSTISHPQKTVIPPAVEKPDHKPNIKEPGLERKLEPKAPAKQPDTDHDLKKQPNPSKTNPPKKKKNGKLKVKPKAIPDKTPAHDTQTSKSPETGNAEKLIPNPNRPGQYPPDTHYKTEPVDDRKGDMPQ